MLAPSIDFEFRSGTDIKLGLPKYFADPEAAVLCFAWDMNDGRGPQLWTPGSPCPVALYEHVERGGKVRGWNVMFEWYAWNTQLVTKYGFPPLLISQLEDSMAEAQAMNLPAALAKAAIALQLPDEHQKSRRGKQLIKLLCIPQNEPLVLPLEAYARKASHTRAVNEHAKWVAAGGRWINDPGLLQELYDYCIQDVVTETAVSRKLRRLSDYEQKVWVKTQEINQRGVPVDLDEICNIATVVDAEVERLNDELCTLTEGVVTAGTERGALLEWCNARLPTRSVEIEVEGFPAEVDGETGEILGFATRKEIVQCPQMDDLQAETVERVLLHLVDMPANVRRVLEIRAAVSQTSTAKLHAMLDVAAPDGTLKNMYVYHGASTGRDASKGGVNLQNITRPRIDDIATAHEVLGQGDHALAYMIFGDQVMDAAVACVRGVIKAPHGYEFIDGDFSSVENRGSAWISGQDDVLQAFADGLDEYKLFAADMYGVPYEAVTKHQRQVAKSAVLGCMFGQGAAGLVAYALGMGVVLTLEKAQELVDRYRKKYYMVKACWYACGNAAIDAVNHPTPEEPGAKPRWFTPRARVNGEMHSFEKLMLACHKNFLWLKLPSGRLIAWAAPRIEERKTPWGVTRAAVTVSQEDGITKQWRRDVLIGSSIFQSGVQGMARDLLIDGMFAVEERGYPVLMRSHDELLSMVPAGTGDCDEFGQLMCRPKVWCPDLPLAYEAWRGNRFRK